MELKIIQKTLHHSVDDFITAKYLYLQGTNYEIGKKLGELAQSRHFIERPMNGSDLNRSIYEYFKDNYPIHFQRMRGLADAYGHDIFKTGVDFSGYGNPNAQSACSAVFYPPASNLLNAGIISRNADLPLIPFATLFERETSLKENKNATFYILEQHPDIGYASIGVFCFELYGSLLDGVNSEGLMVVHLAATDDETGYCLKKRYHTGINEMLSVQLILDTCKDTEEAKKCLRSQSHYVIHIPIHLLVADKFGNSFIWELDENGNQHFTDNKNSPQIITNFEIFKYLNSTDYPDNGFEACPFNRFTTIKNQLEVNSQLNISAIKEINKSVFISDNMLQSGFPLKVRTLYHQIYNSNKKEIQISFFCRDEDIKGLQQVRTDYFIFRLKDFQK